jgi:hypothetical protein
MELVPADGLGRLQLKICCEFVEGGSQAVSAGADATSFWLI